MDNSVSNKINHMQILKLESDQFKIDIVYFNTDPNRFLTLHAFF